jgi:hypothetical protein
VADDSEVVQRIEPSEEGSNRPRFAIFHVASGNSLLLYPMLAVGHHGLMDRDSLFHAAAITAALLGVATFVTLLFL